MNWKKFFFAFIAAWIFVFVFGFVWFGNLMHNIHNEVPTLWRTEADFGSHFPWLVFGHAVMAFFLTFLYARFVPAGGAGAYRQRLHHVCSATANDENPLRLGCRGFARIRHCRRNHWRDLQTCPGANDTLRLNRASTNAEPDRNGAPGRP